MRRFLAALLVACVLASGARAQSGITAGAIRWDAWYATTAGSASIAAQNNLGPVAYQSRAPKHCQVNSAYKISCVGTQAIIDAEITAAVSGGLAFWAYDQYATNSDLSVAWNYHQTSSIKNQMNWCWINGGNFMGSTGAYTTAMDALVVQFQQANYQKITVSTANRPILFILWDTTTFASLWGSNYTNLADAITYLRSASISAGLGTPYITVLTSVAATAATIATNIGADAIGTYYTPITSILAAPGAFTALDTLTQATWVTQGATGTPFVLNSIGGWDQRPRLARPLPWLTAQRPYFNGMYTYYAQSTNSEQVTALAAGVAYINAHPAQVPSKLMLIYSWDEMDEGGAGLSPTIGDPTGTRLAAIRSTIGN